MKAALPDISEEDRCEPCGRKRPACQLCSNGIWNFQVFENLFKKPSYVL